MKRWPFAALLALALALGWAPGRAEAHPLGNFTVNQYSRIEVGREIVRLRYVVDMAEIPAFQERQAIDADANGSVSAPEAEAYLARQVPALLAGLLLEEGGAPLELRLVRRELSFPAGQGGLPTLRLVLDAEAARPGRDGAGELIYRDGNYVERIGWREIVARPLPGAALERSTVPAEDRSDELRSYPEDMLASPPDVREARLGAAPAGTGQPGGQAESQAAGAVVRPADPFAALVAGELTPGVIAAALLLAFVLGAGHALTPGHGKTIVAAYMVGARGTVRHALFLGVTTTLTHTAGVFLLGAATLLLSQYVLPERIYPWLELVSGFLVVAIGAALLRARVQSWLGRRQRNHHHGHGHDHDHEHGPHTHTHDHDFAAADWLSGGAPGDERPRTIDEGQPHDAAGIAQPRTRVSSIVHRPSSDGLAPSWRSLLAVGISGGLLPCPSALVVLLSAIALHRVAFGMLLIVAFSAGLAGVLTGIGVLLVYARRLFDRFPVDGRLLRTLPIASATLVTLAGLAISAAALARAGVL